MVIGIGNTKAGTGKSTLALLLASYLAEKQKMSVYLSGREDRWTLGWFGERSALLEHAPPFEYLPCEIRLMGALREKLGAGNDSYILIDLPSDLQHTELIAVIAGLELLICPFCYDGPTLNASIYFASLALRIRPSLRLLFVPNRIIQGAGYPLKEQADKVLRQIGSLSTAIPSLIGFQRISSMLLPAGLLESCGATLDLIHSQYLCKSKKR
ncbi:hypothetical protein [Pedobacter miscanthi]|uniref:hypothetical protein n=1 Tax=Pedobacter miscanthi TaxID=2259170 RepID=UPI00292DA6FF|nr:hypothetical protein [Pedobacter miscanthi]